jgi:DNA (cytosine-5)-methyltransferase 1
LGKTLTKYIPYTVDDIKKSSSRQLFTVVSTFAGGGGSSTGYRIAGGKVIAMNEFVEEAVKTYSTNFPDTKIIPGDIKKLTGLDFLREANLKPGELDIFDGSPPCSAFSVAGKREKQWKGAVRKTDSSFEIDDDGELEFIEGETITKSGIKTYSDGMVVEAIEDLFLEFVRIAKDIKPKVIVAENVKGITMGEARKKLVEFQNAFENIEPGYVVTHHVLNAANYGVPQARERLFFVCVRSDVADAIGMNWMNAETLTKPPETTPIIHSGGRRLSENSQHISLREAIGDMENDPEEVQMLKDYVMAGFQKNWITKLPFNPKRHTKPSDSEFKSWNPTGSCFNMIRPCPELPCPTLTQRGQQRSVSGVFHYAENRKFTIKELKRIMSLPEDYILSGDFDKQAERIGRMVAPKMMGALATNIYNKILKPYKEATQ